MKKNYSILIHMLSQLSNLFSKKYLFVYVSLIFSICINYICSLISIISSIYITLIFPIKSESLTIITIIIIIFILYIIDHAIRLTLVHLSKINIISVYIRYLIFRKTFLLMYCCFSHYFYNLLICYLLMAQAF